MFQKILVPVDLTDRHQPALEIAAKLVTPGGEVILLHVIEVLPGLPREEEPSFYQRLERKADIYLHRLSDVLQERHVTVRSVVLLGERVPEVLRYAEEQAADLLVLTSHPVDPAKP